MKLPRKVDLCGIYLPFYAENGSGGALPEASGTFSAAAVKSKQSSAAKSGSHLTAGQHFQGGLMLLRGHAGAAGRIYADIQLRGHGL